MIYSTGLVNLLPITGLKIKEWQNENEPTKQRNQPNEKTNEWANEWTDVLMNKWRKKRKNEWKKEGTNKWIRGITAGPLTY